VPDFSTLLRRQKTLKLNIPYRGSDGWLHLLVDSTGIKLRAKRSGTCRIVNQRRTRIYYRPLGESSATYSFPQARDHVRI